MSFAFEITPHDVFRVLEAHDAAGSPEDGIVEDCFAVVMEQEARITESVLEHRGERERMLAALQEIEAILIEDDVLDGPPLDGSR